MARRKKDKLVIGKTDKADFPKLHLFDLDIKVDTGAYTSAIHCNNIYKVKSPEGERIHFDLLDPSHPDYHGREFMIKDFKQKRVKSSIGEVETRYIIKSQIVLFEREFEIELSLSNRGEMRYPVLLGRKLLKGAFVVDVSKTNLSYNQKKNKPL